DSQTKNFRSGVLLSLCTKNFRHFVEKFKDRELRILVEELDNDGYYEGLTDNYIRIKVKSEHDIRGEFVNIRILDIMDDYCIGELISKY
ncbi:TRAM domain-containing protein, partial [Peptostreptococcus porci]|nr:tRNA (N(6)-L-threonylcarbamoyladenosine(37)-C(2))-methylthiotransferase MtaB [Peptostreptococcus porci]